MPGNENAVFVQVPEMQVLANRVEKIMFFALKPAIRLVLCLRKNYAGDVPKRCLQSETISVKETSAMLTASMQVPLAFRYCSLSVYSFINSSSVSLS